jgi:hypothetical protein
MVYKVTTKFLGVCWEKRAIGKVENCIFTKVHNETDISTSR